MNDPDPSGADRLGRHALTFRLQPPPPSAIVVARDEETRVLLRALLRLYHFRFEGEAEGTSQAIRLLRAHRPSHAVVDANLAEGDLIPLFTQARSHVPGIRIVLVAPASRPPNLPNVAAHRPDVVLLRPFRIRQFGEALMPVAPGYVDGVRSERRRTRRITVEEELLGSHERAARKR